MSKVYKVEPKALLKVLLHSCKYPAASLNGVLLGNSKVSNEQQAQDSSSELSSSSKQIVIVDALPLCHSFLSLAPAIEIALIQAELAAKETGLELVGYYHINQRLNDLEFGPVARKLADRLQSFHPDSCALLVDNNRLGQFLRGLKPHIFELYTRDSGRGWTKQGSSSSSSSQLEISSSGLSAQAIQMHKDGRHQRLHDFDDHLEDLSRDWLNQKLI